MIFVCAARKALYIPFLRHPFRVTIAENYIAAGSAMVIARIRIVPVLFGRICRIPIVGIIDNPNVRRSASLSGIVVLRKSRVYQLIGPAAYRRLPLAFVFSCSCP